MKGPDFVEKKREEMIRDKKGGKKRKPTSRGMQVRTAIRNADLAMGEQHEQ